MEANLNNSFIALGNNQDGCLLTGDRNDILTFTEIQNKLPTTKQKYKIKSGLSSCCLFYDVTLFIWGRIIDSLQDGEKIEKENNKFIKYTFEDSIKDVKSGESHYLILTEKKVYCLGEGLHGELGLGENTTYTTKLNEIPVNVKISKIYSGVRSSFMISGK